MSYPKDLDEYTDEELLKELRRRQDYRKLGLCAYCGSPFETKSPCRLHETVNDKQIIIINC